jgi:hypothetical protein
MSVTLSNVFASVAGEKLGFSYGKPKRVDAKSLTVLLPILRETTLKRQYVTFPETEKCLIFDTGRIDEMEARNESGENVFIRSGTLFRGSTQERALQRSAVIFSGQKGMLPVRCVHRSRGITGGSKVVYGGLTPLNLDKSNYHSGYKFKDQGETWANVQKTNMLRSAEVEKKRSGSENRKYTGQSVNQTMGETVGSMWDADMPITSAGATHCDYFMHEPKQDDLASNLDHFALNFEEILSKVKLEKNQAGIALITDGGVETIEIFDHADSWKALHESAVKRMGAELVKEDPESVFEFKPKHAVSMVNKVLALAWARNLILERRPEGGEPKLVITGLTSGEYVGEVVELNDQVIHLTFLKKAA